MIFIHGNCLITKSKVLYKDTTSLFKLNAQEVNHSDEKFRIYDTMFYSVFQKTFLNNSYQLQTWEGNYWTNICPV